jgi:hypothetical protein
VQLSPKPGRRDADVLFDAAFQSDGRLLNRESRVLFLPLPSLGGQDAVRDQANGGGSQGTGFHRRGTNVRGGDADEVPAQEQDQAAAAGR